MSKKLSTQHPTKTWNFPLCPEHQSSTFMVCLLGVDRELTSSIVNRITYKNSAQKRSWNVVVSVSWMPQEKQRRNRYTIEKLYRTSIQTVFLGRNPLMFRMMLRPGYIVLDAGALENDVVGCLWHKNPARHEGFLSLSEMGRLPSSRGSSYSSRRTLNMRWFAEYRSLFRWWCHRRKTTGWLVSGSVPGRSTNRLYTQIITGSFSNSTYCSQRCLTLSSLQDFVTEVFLR